MIVLIIGGTSLLEIACFRLLSEDPNFPFSIIIASTKIITGNSLLKLLYHEQVGLIIEFHLIKYKQTSKKLLRIFFFTEVILRKNQSHFYFFFVLKLKCLEPFCISAYLSLRHSDSVIRSHRRIYSEGAKGKVPLTELKNFKKLNFKISPTSQHPEPKVMKIKK